MSAPAIADKLARRLTWEELDPRAVTGLLLRARDEDLEGFGLLRAPDFRGDLSSSLLPEPEKEARARLMAREDLVFCGAGLVPMVLAAYGDACRFTAAAKDGQLCRKDQCLGTIEGPARRILEAERVLLNFLQHLSGIATQTNLYAAALNGSGIRLLDTRKTTPGYRLLEKYAVACGGGFNHRLGLFDRVMLKDNHLAAGTGSGGLDLKDLVGKARTRWPGIPVEVEVDLIGQIPEILEAGVEAILLDNFQPPELEEALNLVGDRAATEASGGITLDALPAITGLNLDFISTGAVVHQATWKDIALDWE